MQRLNLTCRPARAAAQGRSPRLVGVRLLGRHVRFVQRVLKARGLSSLNSELELFSAFHSQEREPPSQGLLFSDRASSDFD